MRLKYGSGIVVALGEATVGGRGRGRGRGWGAGKG